MMTIMRPWCLRLLFGLLVAQPAVAADFNTCLRQTGGQIMPYDSQDTDGALGGYRLSVNDLFAAGLCRGAAPLYRSYQWEQCDFKGPAALYNRISGPADIIGQPNLQDKIVQELVIARSIAQRDLLQYDALRPLQRFQNAADLLGGLLHRKGATAVKLLAIADINSFDKLGYSTSDYIRFYAQCAGDNTVGQRRALFGAAQPASPSVDAQAINWRPLNDMPTETKDRVLRRVPELRLVFGTQEPHRYAEIMVGANKTVLVALSGIDFCNDRQCTYYLFRNQFAHVVTFYAGAIQSAPGRNGLLIDGFYKPVEELGK